MRVYSLSGATNFANAHLKCAVVSGSLVESNVDFGSV